MSSQASPASLLPAVRDFAEAVAAKFKTLKTVEGQAEAQLVAPVESLLTASQALVKGKLNITNESATAEQKGRPDFAVGTDGLLQGYVELKAPGKGARPGKFTDKYDKAQWAKFRQLPNILYTDGNEWGLYQEGSDDPVALVVFDSDVTVAGAKAFTDEQATSLASLLQRFFDWVPIVPKNPKDLAIGLARLCHYLREDVERAVGDDKSNLSEVMREWQARLFPDADKKRFADAYAQTVAYALLLAHSRGLNAPDLGKAVTLLEPAHGLLGQALNVLTQPTALAEVRPAVDVLFRYVLAVDLSVLAKSPGEPWLYFYEDFLAEYDPNLRKDYGVYYTPAPVVKAQVTLVTALLRDRFGRKLGLADDNVTVLDPGVGTATYLLGVIESGVERARAFGGPGYVGERTTMMGGNIHGFETLVGPYAVSHLRMSEELARHGAKLPSDGIHVYLTDTLESPNAAAPTVVGLFGKKLSEEHSRALKVKGSIPILVCIGNPPYDRHPAADAKQRGGWVRHGDKDTPKAPLQTFIEPVQAAGRGGDLKNLYNSYVYFWRWALWKVFEQTESPGIVAFITASSYLRGPAFLGMREQMRRTFDEMWIIDLGGDNLGPRKTPNVFAIQTPVAIAIGARYGKPKPETPADVRYCSLVEGTREEKLARLNEVKDWNSLKWEPVMSGWQQPLLPQRSSAYWSWPLLTDIFPWQHSGVKAGRTWVIVPHVDTLHRRWLKLVKGTKEERKRLFKDSPTGRKVHEAATQLPPSGIKLAPISEVSSEAQTPPLVRYAYRSFDRQYIMADARVLDRPGPALWYAHGERQVYLTSLLTTVLGLGPAATVTNLIPDLHHYRGSFGDKDVIPLWHNAGATEANVTKGLLEALAKRYR